MIGEGLEKLHLWISERAHLSASNRNCPNYLASSDQRDCQNGAVTKAAGEITTLGIFLAFSLQIGDLKRSPIKDSAPHDSPTG